MPTSYVHSLAFKPRACCDKAQNQGTKKLHMVKFLFRLNILAGPQGFPAPHLPERPAIVLCSCPGPRVCPGPGVCSELVGDLAGEAEGSGDG